MNINKTSNSDENPWGALMIGTLLYLQEMCILAADDWEISPDDLELQGSLGKGQFGDVKLALVKNMSCTSKLKNYMVRQVAAGESLSTSRAVAVKYLRGMQSTAKYFSR